MNYRCSLCAHDLETSWVEEDAKSDELLVLALCARCGLVQQCEIPDSEQLAIYYSHHYRNDYKSTHRPRAKHVHRSGVAALHRLAFMARAGIPLGLQMLDVGAGGGEFCYLASKAGYRAAGIEPHVGYSGFAREQYDVDIRTSGIDSLAAAEVDVITLFHVFEHLADPLAAVAKLWSALKEGGFLVMEVPNLHQMDASPSNIYFKAHLYYYSRYSLLAAVSRHFELLCIEEVGNLRIALRRRSEPLAQPLLPTPAQVAITRRRLEEKGWVEYLFAGKGAAKFITRIENLWTESRVRHRAPREILDSLNIDDIHRRPVAVRAALVGGLALMMDACT